MCNAVKRPYYWFPYGFRNNSNIPVYHELYPGALKEVSENINGYIYEVDADENQVIPFKNIPCAKLATEPVKVEKCIKVNNAYNLFMEFVEQGRMEIGYFQNKTEKELEYWYSMILDYLKEKDMLKIPDCSYTCFIKKKFPQIWERYIKCGMTPASIVGV